MGPGGYFSPGPPAAQPSQVFDDGSPPRALVAPSDTM